MPSLDIIMTVYNRQDVLKKVLEALFTQHLPETWEVGLILCDDGSAQDIAQVVYSLPTPPPQWRQLIFFKQTHQGIAAARNAALKRSQAEIVLFLGADIILTPGALAAHIAFHEQQPVPQAGALGLVQWDSRLSPTPFMDWMVHGGPQNNFDDVIGATTCDPRHHFYAAHVSVKRAILQDTWFRSGYEPYGWEDLDMGHALAKKNLQLYVLQKAVGLHHHAYSTHAILKRQYWVGYTIPQFLHYNTLTNPPTLTATRVIKLWVARLSGIRFVIRTLISLYGEKHATPNLYKWATTTEFWYGMWKGSKKAIIKQK